MEHSSIVPFRIETVESIIKQGYKVVKSTNILSN
jgi:hypothetical protein